MFYCTIYKSYNRANAKNKTFELERCLAYNSEADAEKMKDQLLQQAKNSGAETIEAFGPYRTVYGATHFVIGGMTPSKLGSRIYSIGVENQSTLFSRLSKEQKAAINLDQVIMDGHKYEKITQDYLQRQKNQKKAEQDKIDYNLSNFEKEIADILELEQILKVFLKYAEQKVNTEKLIELTVKKIKGEQEKTSDWFEELSDIN